MKQIQISFERGIWQNTCYRPMDSISAQRIADRLAAAYTEYAYRVIDVK